MKESIIIKLSKDQKQRIKELAGGKVSEYVLSKVFPMTMGTVELKRETTNDHVNSAIVNEIQKRIEEKIVDPVKVESIPDVAPETKFEPVKNVINVNRFINAGVMEIDKPITADNIPDVEKKDETITKIEPCALCGDPNAKQYDRNGKTYWLCFSHKP